MAGMYEGRPQRGVWRNPATGGFYPGQPGDDEEAMPPDPFDEEDDTFSATDVARLLRAANAPDPDDGEEEARDLVAATDPTMKAASLAPPAPRRKKKQSMPGHGQWEVQIKEGKRWGWLASFYGPPPDKDRIRERFGSGEFRIVEQQTGWTASFTIAHQPDRAAAWDTGAGAVRGQRPVEEVVAETVSAVVPNAVSEAVAGLMEQFQPVLAGLLQRGDGEDGDSDPRLVAMERELEMTRAALAQMSQQQQPTNGSSNPIMEAVMEKVVSAGLENLGVREKEDDEESFVSQALRAATAMFEARTVAAANAPPQIGHDPGLPVQRPSLAGMTPEIETELRQHAGRLGLDFNEAIIEAQTKGVNAPTLLNLARAQ
jgi:hypothetical protein